MLKDSSSFDLYHVSITWQNKSHVMVRGYNLGEKKHTRCETHWSVKHSWDEVVPNALHLILGLVSLVELFRLSQDGAFRVNTNNLHRAHHLRINPNALIVTQGSYCILNIFYNLIIYFDVGAFFLEFAGNARDGSTCASSCHQHVHFTWWRNFS